MASTNQSNKVGEEQVDHFDYAKRAQWLRAAVLGANDGLVSTASLMMGVGAVRQDVKAMILTGFAGLVAGACSMAIGEFVSVYSQYDIEVAQMRRDTERGNNTTTTTTITTRVAEIEEMEKEKKNEESLPSPVQAAAASGLAFSVGAMVPLLAASFIRDYKVRLGVMIGAVTLALVVFGWIGAVLGNAPVVKSSMRVLIGGWMAMAVTFALTKSVDTKHMDLF
ncbi:Vacuolar iron transporter homolog 4 [Linum grandiflorum]